MSQKGLLVKESQAIGVVVVFGILVILLLLLIGPAWKGRKLQEKLDVLGVVPEETFSALEEARLTLVATEEDLATCNALSAGNMRDVLVRRNQTLACEEAKRELFVEKEQLAAQYNFNLSRVQAQIEQLAFQYTLNLSRVRSELEDEKNTALLGLEDLQREVRTLQINYESLATNTAENICCKQRFDNPSINSYTVTENRIVCGVGEKFNLTCEI